MNLEQACFIRARARQVARGPLDADLDSTWRADGRPTSDQIISSPRRARARSWQRQTQTWRRRPGKRRRRRPRPSPELRPRLRRQRRPEINETKLGLPLACSLVVPLTLALARSISILVRSLGKRQPARRRHRSVSLRLRSMGNEVETRALVNGPRRALVHTREMRANAGQATSLSGRPARRQTSANKLGARQVDASGRLFGFAPWPTSK